MARLKPIHPREILREEFMAPLRLNANKLALALHVPAPTKDTEDPVSEQMPALAGSAVNTTARPDVAVAPIA